jgi:hypothetical protein
MMKQVAPDSAPVFCVASVHRFGLVNVSQAGLELELLLLSPPE